MLNEKAVQDIVKEVVAKLNLGAEVETGMGIFTDMNEAIAAAKKSAGDFEENVHGPKRKNHFQHSQKDAGKC